MQPTLIGYFPKRNATPPPRSAPANVLELGNVGFCDGLAPKGWVDSWLHNEFWLYDTEMLAWGVALQTDNLRRMHDELAKTWDGVRGSVQQALAIFIDQHIPPPEACADWEETEPHWQLFAYRLFPTLFTPGERHAIEFPDLGVSPLPADYERLGCDPVSVQEPQPGCKALGSKFAHSSLSPCCNGLCGEIPVNRFCLLDTAEEGLCRAEEFANGGGEPEPYVLVEVWRKRLPRWVRSGEDSPRDK